MTSAPRVSALAILISLAAACGGESTPDTAPTDDTDVASDSGESDSGASDTGAELSPEDTSDVPDDDAGSDTGTDVTTDVGDPDTDAGDDDVPDSSGDTRDDAADAELDTAPDAAPDATTDADSDATSDASDDTADSSDAADVPDVPTTGPQIIDSSVFNGQIGASRSLSVTLRFDRPIPLENFEGNVFATSEGVPAPTPMLATGCLDAPEDLACVVVTFDAPFIQPGTSELYPATYHTVIVTSGLVADDGITNDSDTLLTFSTEGTLLLYQGSDPGVDASGIAYDPQTRSLFFTEVSNEYGDDFGPATIQRIRNPDGLFVAPTMFALVFPTTQSSWFSELDVVDGSLYVSLPYDSKVRTFDDLRFDGAFSTGGFAGTGLAAPNDSLLQVNSVAVLDGGARHIVGFGNYVATDRPTALAQFVDGAWSLLGAGSFSTADDFFVAAREDALPGLVFVAAEGELVALSSETGERVNAHPYGSPGRMGRIAIDSAGRLYSRNRDVNPLAVFDVSGTDGFVTLATLNLGARDRFAISERGNVITVYSLSYRRQTVVYRDRIVLCDGEAPCISSCDNREQDGTETDIDCGGSCDPCPVASACVVDSDCANENCDAGFCGDRRPNGCSDGTREGFVDEAAAPNIAGCTGAWTVRGVVGSVEPSCERQAGNDGLRADGINCGAVDLCAPGWRICTSPANVAENAPGGTCGTVTRPDDPPLFFATATRSSGGGACSPPFVDGANDIFGCGNFGAATPSPGTCGPLDRFSGDLCSALRVIPGLDAWVCGSDAFNEARNVIHPIDVGGGVLCCATCTPSCELRTCGDDGCGGSCGECPEGTSCGPFGFCGF